MFLGRAKEGEGKKGKEGGKGIGARGLRAVMESVLGEIMYRGPGSEGIKFCLVDGGFVEEQGRSGSKRPNDHDGADPTVSSEREDGYRNEREAEGEGGEEMMPSCWGRGQKTIFEEAWREEEESWEIEHHGDTETRGRRKAEVQVQKETLMEWRVAGSSGM